MNEQTGEPDYADAASTMADGLDAVLAMLLLSRRLHVEDLSLSGSDRAKIELSGEAIRQGLATMAQVMTILPAGKSQTEAQKGEAGHGETASPSIWQALKEFALPPPVKGNKKK